MNKAGGIAMGGAHWNSFKKQLDKIKINCFIFLIAR
jgi:hypothetical protein